MAPNSQVTPSASTTWWKQPLAFSLLICAPLIVGGVRHVVAPTAKVAVSTDSLAPEREPTMFVATFASDDAVLVVQANDQKETVEQDEKKSSEDQEAGAGESKEPEQQKTEPKEKETAADDKADKPDAEAEKQPKDPSSDSSDQDPECCNANSEFSEWSTTLDDDIRKAVIAAITNKLTTATENLDKQQERLERLQVETELYKLQIQHLRNRLKEWDTAD